MSSTTRTPRSQSEIDALNIAFWDEKCGSLRARSLGITQDDPASLAKFDAWYFGAYSYLERFVPEHAIRGKDVLDVGLGYGSMSQRLAERGARLTTLDIAHGPAVGVRTRLSNNRLRGLVVRGSILDPPLRPGSFDYIVAIGCYHHTGNLPRAIAQTAALLREGGGATIMSHSATSYLRWIREPARVLRYFASVAAGTPPPLPLLNTGEYDKRLNGEVAPETVLVSKTHFGRLLRSHFRTVQIWRANAAAVAVPRLGVVPRPVLLATLGRFAGLDLYAQVRK
jgi:2-polyprenyl-3-methyl-5-hydroxy-6-metoxy-1,4-benzoquinol methylase